MTLKKKFKSFEEGFQHCKNQDWPTWRINQRDRIQHVLCDSEEEGSDGSESDTEETAAAELNGLKTRRCSDVTPPHMAAERRRRVNILAADGDEPTKTCDVNRRSKEDEEDRRVYGEKFSCIWKSKFIYQRKMIKNKSNLYLILRFKMVIV